MSSFNLWYHPLYTDGIHDEARFPKNRYQKLLHRLEQSERFNQLTIRKPEPIARRSLLLAHDATYVDGFLEGKLSEKEMRRIGLTPWTPKMIERTLRLTGGAVEATIHAVKYGGITGNMAGGTHHAHRDFGSGYCVFNDLAISAMHAIENLGVGRVAILDLDVHQGMEQQQSSQRKNGLELFLCTALRTSHFESLRVTSIYQSNQNQATVCTWKRFEKLSNFVLIFNRISCCIRRALMDSNTTI